MTTTLRISLWLCAITGITSAHEFWIEPASYHPVPGNPVRVGLRLGERFLGDVMPRVDKKIDRFALYGPNKTGPVVGRSGGSVSFVRPKADGWHTIAYRSRRTLNQMPADRFEAYLKEEGLHAILPRRAKLGESDKPGREVFSRCAKALLLVGSYDDQGFDRTIGLPLEITLITNPVGMKAGEKLLAHVTLRGNSLPGTRVVAASQRAPGHLHEATTGCDGRVTFDLPHGGPWMLTTIHMTRAPNEVDADWESLWASLTFEVPLTPRSEPRIELPDP